MCSSYGDPGSGDTDPADSEVKRAAVPMGPAVGRRQGRDPCSLLSESESIGSEHQDIFSKVAHGTCFDTELSPPSHVVRYMHLWQSRHQRIRPKEQSSPSQAVRFENASKARSEDASFAYTSVRQSEPFQALLFIHGVWCHVVCIIKTIPS